VFWAVALEEAYAAVALDLLEGLADDRAHVVLVVFVGAEDVEVLEADDAVEEVVAQGPEIEHVLGVAVHVERAKCGSRSVRIGVALSAFAVGCGGTGVDEA